MRAQTQPRLSSKQIQALWQEAKKTVRLTSGSRLTTLDDFFYDNYFDSRHALEILHKLRIICSLGSPFNDWDNEDFFETILLKLDRPRGLPVIHIQERFLTKRGAWFLKRILMESECRPYPYKRRK